MSYRYFVRDAWFPDSPKRYYRVAEDSVEIWLNSVGRWDETVSNPLAPGQKRYTELTRDDLPIHIEVSE